MTPSPACLALIERFEGRRLKAYLDPVGIWTIGIGTTIYPNGKTVQPTDRCTDEQADAYLMHDVAWFGDMVEDAVDVMLTQGRFDALVSILYNVGPGRSDRPGLPGRDGIITLRSGHPSTLLRKLNAGDFTGASAEFPKWNEAGGRVLGGLVKRREAERALFDQSDATA
jgi:lysozyme